MTVGGAFFISAAQAAFNNQLIKQIALKLPEIDPLIALGIGATQIRTAFTSAQAPLVVDAYVTGLKSVFAIAAAGFVVAALIGVFGRWKKLHGRDVKEVEGGVA